MKIEILDGDVTKVFICSDSHYGHTNIVRGVTTWKTGDGQRPINSTRDFQTVEDMNELIVNNINNVVGQDDILIHVGDFSFGGFENIPKFRSRINCKTIHLCLGNHDCFDCENTEILTEDGFISFDTWKLTKPKIASYNTINNKLEYDLPITYYHNDYDGDMYYLNNRLIDLCVTPNHRLYVSRMATKDKSFKFIKIEDIPKCKTPINFKSSINNNNDDIEISDDLIKLTGWILSDGSVREGLYGVSYCIYQSEGKHMIIEELLNNLEIPYRRVVRDRKIKKIIDKDIKNCKISYE